MTTSNSGPLMSGTRLFLQLVLGSFYAVTAILMLAALAAPFLASSTPAAGELSKGDLAMIFALLAFMLGLTVFFRQLLAIVKSVASGDPFQLVNAMRLRVMAWMALAVWVIDLALIAYTINDSPSASSADFLGEHVSDLIAQAIDLSIPLTLFILARVFRHGAAMREDLEGTV